MDGSVIPYGFLGVVPPGDTVVVLFAGLSLILLLVCVGIGRLAHRWRNRAGRLCSTLDGIDAAVFITTAGFTIVEANAAATALLEGRDRTSRRPNLLDVLGLSEGDRTHARDLLRHEGAAGFDAVLAQKAGERSMRVRLQSIRAAQIDRVVALLVDVTEDRALAAHYERFLDHLIRQVPVEVCILSPDGKYRFLSSSLVVEESRQSWLIGKTDFDYCRATGLHSEIALRRRAHRMEAVDRRETVFFEERLTVNGSSQRLAWRYVPFMDETGNVQLVLGFGLDETELNTCRADLEIARGDQAKSVSLKEALLQNVSHEIRTPLSSIIGAAQMLRSEVDPALQEFLVDIESNAQRMSETLNGILDLAGLQAENLELEPVLMDVRQEVEDIVRAFRSSADRRGLFLECGHTKGELFIRGDRDAFVRSVSGLLDNALKFTKEGGVVIDVARDEDHAVIRVMDSGVGIGRGRHADVFEAFRQEEDGLDRTFEGTGVGLAVTERLVRYLGGQVHVYSRKGVGSSFVIRLPLAMRATVGKRPSVLLMAPQDESHRLVEHLLRDHFDVDSVCRLTDLLEWPDGSSYDAVVIDERFGDGCAPNDLVESLCAGTRTAGAKRVFLASADKNASGAVSTRRDDPVERGYDAVVHRPLSKLALMDALHLESPSAGQAP